MNNMSKNIAISAFQYSPSGLTYDSVHDIIERIAKDKAKQYRRIAYYDELDIAQEVRIKCFMTLKNYDPKRSGSNIHTFLSVCADNRLRDIRRNTVYKHNSPCARCMYWNSDAAASGIHDCARFGDKIDCEKFTKHGRYIMAKLSINSPTMVDEKMALDTAHHEHVSAFDFTDFIVENLPSGHVSIFMELKDNNFNLRALGKSDRHVIIKDIRDIFDKEECDGR